MLSLGKAMSSRGMISRLFNECSAIAKWSETAVGCFKWLFSGWLLQRHVGVHQNDRLLAALLDGKTVLVVLPQAD